MKTPLCQPRLSRVTGDMKGPRGGAKSQLETEPLSPRAWNRAESWCLPNLQTAEKQVPAAPSAEQVKGWGKGRSGIGRLPLVGGSRKLSTVHSCQGLGLGLGLSIEKMHTCHAPTTWQPLPVSFRPPGLLMPTTQGQGSCFPQMQRVLELDRAWDSLGQFPPFIDGKTGPGRRWDLPKVIQKVGGRAETGLLSENVTAPSYAFLDMLGCPFPWLHLLLSKYLLSTCYVPDSVPDLRTQ